ncbi:MAG: UDP-N-acetylmuramate dehydrogenase [Marinobacter sp.]|nr:UDP-N-acetylmuramate dehydrogenase [Marinobacter sp.]
MGTFSPATDVDLTSLNTLRLPARARYFARIETEQALQDALAWARKHGQQALVIGGGSNLVLCGDISGLVLHMAIMGRSWEVCGDGDAILTLGAGEDWHRVVMYACRAGYRGIENLALIPGTVGAAPVQNIGAYGAELKDTLVELRAWDAQQQAVVTLSGETCGFGYRDSVFKQHLDRYIILSVRLKLSRQRPFNLSYRELAEHFDNDTASYRSLTPLQVAEAVKAIRRRKLPDPDHLPNAGSFFKNPLVPWDTYQALKTAHPSLVAYEGEGEAKLAAAWLIDQCGWKGHREAHVGVHNKQALVLINHGNGTGPELMDLANRIRSDVEARFGVTLEMEPRRVP